MNCGAMLRECIRYEALTKILLNSDNFYDFFKYVEVSTFDIASDAFATFKVCGSLWPDWLRLVSIDQTKASPLHLSRLIQGNGLSVCGF